MNEYRLENEMRLQDEAYERELVMLKDEYLYEANRLIIVLNKLIKTII